MDPYRKYSTANSNDGPTFTIHHTHDTKKSIFQSALAGAFASALHLFVVYPFEYIKTQLQLDTSKKKLYRGTVDCAKKTAELHGFTGLYRGLSIMLINGVGRSAVRFGSWEYIKSLYVDKNNYLSSNVKLLSGLSAGVLEALVIDVPTQTIKTKIVKDYRSSKPKYKGLIHATHSIIQEEGVSGIYRGTMASVWSLGIAQSVRFFIIATLEDIYRADDPQKMVPNLYVGFSAGVAGFVSVLATQPLDVIKTRFQGDKKRIGMRTEAIDIWRREGLRGFYSGTMPRLGTRVFGLAITFMLYDEMLKVLHIVWEDN